MKQETKQKLKKFGSKAWGITKICAWVGGAVALLVGAFIVDQGAGHTYEPSGESDEDRQKREAEEQRRREEHEQFLASLTPHERQMHERIEALEHENVVMRGYMQDLSEQNDHLKSQVSDLESSQVQLCL